MWLFLPGATRNNKAFSTGLSPILDRAVVGEIGSELYALECNNVYRYSPNDKNWLLVVTGAYRFSRQTPLVVGDKLCEVDVFERVVGCFEPATNKITVSKPVPAPAVWVAYGTGYTQSTVTVGGRIYAFFTYTEPEVTIEKLRKVRGSLQEYNLETDTYTK